jgi:PAS domain S-box-containing protein
VRGRPTGDGASTTTPEALLGAVVASLTDGVAVVDKSWRFLLVNPVAESLLGAREEELLGLNVWDRFPVMRDSPTYEAAIAVGRDGGRHDLLWYHPERRQWYAQQISSTADHIVIVSREITDQHTAETRNRLLLEISEALNAVETPEEAGEVIITSALPITGAIAGGVLLRELGAPYLRGLRWSGLSQEIIEHFVRYPLDTASPGAEAVRTGRITWAPAADAATRWPIIDEALKLSGARAVVGVPLAVLGDPLGALIIHLATDAPLEHSAIEFLRTVAAMCAQAISRTQRRVAEHEVALALQRSLLPAVPGRVGDVELHVDYSPGDPGVDIGGDWYDVIETSSGLVLVVGDVEGHDAEAAAVMAQLHSAVRAFVLDGHEPGSLLQRLDQFLGSSSSDRLATALIIQLGADRSALAASAGHLPPLVRGAGGTWSDLDVPGGPLLGLRTPPSRRSVALRLPERWSLLMYTDGLVESRRDDIVAGIGRLQRALSALPADSGPAAAVDAALHAVPIGQRGDDIAILAARHTR